MLIDGNFRDFNIKNMNFRCDNTGFFHEPKTETTSRVPDPTEIHKIIPEQWNEFE